MLRSKTAPPALVPATPTGPAPPPRLPGRSTAPARRSKAEYQRRRRQQGHDLYFKSLEEKAALRALAEADGYGHDFNAWLLLKVHAALNGSVYPAEYVHGLKADTERLTRWLEAAEQRNETLRREVEVLRAQKDALLAALMDVPEGAELAKAHLQAVAQGVGA